MQLVMYLQICCQYLLCKISFHNCTDAIKHDKFTDNFYLKYIRTILAGKIPSFLLVCVYIYIPTILVVLSILVDNFYKIKLACIYILSH